MQIKSILVSVALLLRALSVEAQLPVVPGAPLTVGMNTRAAYGCANTQPVILHVTNLNDGGSGSFRAAATDSRPRVVVFDISGTITLNSVLTINAPCITIAGQTAPSPGILIRSNGGIPEVAIYVGARDVLMQHFRTRMGDKGCNSNFQFYGGNQHNIILDHMSVSWAQDDNLALNWTNSGVSSDLTVYRSIISEGIFQGANGAGCTGGGATNGHAIFVGPSSGASAYVQNVLATNYERNPYMRADTRTVIMNNIIFQWHGPWGFFYNNGSVSFAGSGNDPGGGPWYSSVVGNRSIPGAKTCCTGNGDDNQAYQFFYSINNVNVINGNQVYKRDNTIAPHPANIVIVEEQNQYPYNPVVGNPPSQAQLPAGYTPLSSTVLEDTLLNVVGARPSDRDAVDARTIQNVKNRTGNYVHDVAEVGGFPALANNTKVFAEVANPHAVTASGYTNLEVQLHGLATALEGGTPPEPPKPGPADVTPADGTIFVSDTFTGTAGTPLVDHHGEVGATYVRQDSAIAGLQLSASGTLLNVGVGDGTLTVASGNPLSKQQDVSADFVTKTLIAGHDYGIWARSSSTNPLSGYAFLYSAASGSWTLNEFVGGGTVVLGSCVRALVAGTTQVILRVRETSIHGVVGGVQCTSAEITNVAELEKVGVSTYFPSGGPDTETTGIHFDNLTATDTVTGETPGIPTWIFLTVIGFFTVIVVALVYILLTRDEIANA